MFTQCRLDNTQAHCHKKIRFVSSFLESLSWWAFLCSVFVGCFLIFSTHKERPQLLVKAYDFGPLLSSRPLSNVGFFSACHTYYYDSHLKAHVTLTPVTERLDLVEIPEPPLRCVLVPLGNNFWNRCGLCFSVKILCDEKKIFQ